jgi:predicted ATPase/class 3 adenylate cyclase
MELEQQQLATAIAALQAQRELLGDAVVETALAPLRARLRSLAAQPDSKKTDSEQTLKQVSVLFADVVGSTTLSQQLDPEDLHTVMDEALARCTAIVHRHGGKVLKYAGDSLLAVYGADEVQEDDAERAVQSGLDLLEEGRRQGELVLQRYRHEGFNLRVGIHTGPVLLGGGLDAENNIRGFTVNVAARMEQTAAAGALRISHDTYHQVRGVFDVVPQEPLQVKGVDAPMVTYLVLRRKPRAFRVSTRGIEGVETRMIGRDAEMEQLQDAFKRMYSQRGLNVVTVVADAGVGKSRLLFEFENWAEARAEIFYFFQGRSHPLTQNQPYGLLRDIVAWRLQIADNDSMATARMKLEQGLVPFFLAEDGADMAQAHAHLLGHLIGLDFADSKHVQNILDDGRQIRNRGFHAAAQMFRRFSIQNSAPVMLLLDDLNWADSGSLDFLSYLIQVNRDVPTLIVAMTRPTLFEQRPDWPGLTDTQRLLLEPLDKGGSRQLVNELLKKMAEIPTLLRELITSGAQGNPFYMEELVKMLADEGAIVTTGEQWSINAEKLLATHVPQTLTGVLQARLDSLKPSEKLALQQASVIGFVFWDQPLAMLDPDSPANLGALVQHELVVPHQDTALDDMVEGVREFAFSHQVLHQVTYDTLLKRTRRAHHAQAAMWFASQTGARANAFLATAAEHFLKADDAQQACEYFTRAAEHAAARYAHEAVSSYVATALTLTDQAAQRWRLLDVRERTLDLQGRRVEQHADIEALQQLSEALDDDRRRCEVAWRHSSFAMRTGDYCTMEAAARQTLALAARIKDDLMALRGQHRLAIALTYLGDSAIGHTLASEALAKARALGERQVETLLLNALSVIADSRGDQFASLAFDQQDLVINRELGNKRNEAIALGNLGNAWVRLGEDAQARTHLEECLRLTRAVGDRATEPNILANLSMLALRQGDDASALAHAQAALDMAEAVQSPVFQAIALCALGNAELALGRHSQATAAFKRAQELALSLDNATRHDASAGLLRVALAQQDAAMARQMVEELLPHLGSDVALVGTEAPYLIRLTCHQALARIGDPRAAQLLASAHADLLAEAITISDAALRKSFLNNIPEHRTIVSLWTSNPVRRS